ncbi:MAG: TetR/AcrR family transcriptional regulator [Oscillospiraceae bacterium]|jgi:AcrR family transcriptional regulator|nr:TetR/AcrR family transcriptional regulator [Oscillospiraceae bacterium]
MEENRRKSDRRIKYTRMVIRDSFIDLLENKNISKITVKEICEGADVNRATFYAHFSDQYDLLKQIELEIITDIGSYLDTRSIGGAEFTIPFEMLKNVLEYVKKNARLCTVLLSPNGDISFQQEITSILGRQFVLAWFAGRTVDPSEIEFIYLFAASGSVGVVRRWLSDGTRNSTSEMAELLLKIASRGTQAFM